MIISPHRFRFDLVSDYEQTNLSYPLSTQKQPLRRSKSNRVIAGVCGGLAEFFGISSFLFRLAFLIALIPGGVPGILAYIIIWLIVPSD